MNSSQATPPIQQPSAAVPPAVARLGGATRRFGSHTVLDGVDLRIASGEFVGLLGRSGSGKTTLLRILAGLDRETSGAIETATEPAVVFQDPRLLPWRTVEQNVGLGLRGESARERSRAALAEVDLGGREDAWPGQLSGGQRQRVALARALVRQPDLLLLDEPFSSLDALTRVFAQEMISALWERHRPAVLLVTHDVEEALLLSDRILVLKDSGLAYDEPFSLDRPRSRDQSELVERRQQLLALLGVGEGATA
jgi:sulfonate transport system ATP-binding protein